MGRLGILIGQHRVALGEGAAPHVLAGEADRGALHQQRPESHGFGRGPVKALTAFEHLALGVHQADDLAVWRKVFRNAGQRGCQRLELLGRQPGLAPAWSLFGGLEPVPGTAEPVSTVRLVRLRRFKLIGHQRLKLGDHLLAFFGRDEALGCQLVSVECAGRALRLDLLVHQRLGESRLVALVMAEAAVTEHIDNHVLLELLPEFRRDTGDVNHSLRIIAVDVEDRRLDRLGDVGTVRPGPRVHRIGGEADLVVDDEVDHPAGAVALQTGQIEHFRHQPLPREGSIAVDQDRHHLGAILVGEAVLLGAGLTHHHRVDGLEVRRIGVERQVHGLTVEFTVG